MKKIKCCGYVYEKSSNPKNWFQFADDTVILSALENDNQSLCNVFSKWVNWADLTIRVDKCHTFGIKKTTTKSIQYEPKLIVNNERIPPVEISESFVYLGKEFSFSMSNDEMKNSIQKELNEYLDKIDRLPIKPLNKIDIITKYVFSKFKWRFSIYKLTETWLEKILVNLSQDLLGNGPNY